MKGSLQHRHINDLEEQAILYAQDNIEKYTPTRQLELDTQVWLISTIMLRCLNNNFITRKFVSNYSKLFEYHLTRDFKNKEIRLEILDYFGISKDIKFMPIPIGSKKQEEFVSIHVMDYLEIFEKTDSLPAPQFHIKQLPMSKGFIYLETPKFVYLLRLVIEQKLYQKIKTMKVYTDNEIINNAVQELRLKHPEFDKAQVSNKNNVPESIKELISKAHEEHHLGHSERIKLGLFLMRNNFDWDYIIDIFSQLSDFSLKTTTYQLNSLKKYIKS